MTITGNATGSSITVNISSSFTGGWLNVSTRNNFCSVLSPPASAWVSADIPAAPGAITGNTAVCPGATNQNYSVVNVAGFTYTWVLPTGMTMVSGLNTNSINVNVGSGFTGGWLRVSATGSCGTAGPQSSLWIGTGLPPAPSAISGPAAVCPGASGVNFSVVSTAGFTYQWTLPTGMTAVGASNGNVLTADIAASFNGGWLRVRAINPACGTTPGPERSMWISRDVPPAPASISGPTAVCPGSTNIVFSVTAVAGYTYQWNLPAGMTAATPSNSSSIEVNVASTFTGGWFSVQAINSTCNVPGPTRSVWISSAVAATPGTMSGPTTVCRGATGIVYSVPVVTGMTYTWSLPTGVTAQTPSTTNSITVDISSSYTGGWLGVRATSSSCPVPSGIRQIWVSGTSCLREAQMEETPIRKDIVFTVFPNPAREEFGVKFKTEEMGELVLNLLDMNGRLVQTRTDQTMPGENILVMDVRNMKSGMYILQILNQEGLKATERVVVE
jgi:hypothetical protein